MHYLKEDYLPVAVCPRCGKKYRGKASLSRTDNVTLICPDCGTREALESIGVYGEEREQIIHIIHRNI